MSMFTAKIGQEKETDGRGEASSHLLCNMLWKALQGLGGSWGWLTAALAGSAAGAVESPRVQAIDTLVTLGSLNSAWEFIRGWSLLLMSTTSVIWWEWVTVECHDLHCEHLGVTLPLVVEDGVLEESTALLSSQEFADMSCAPCPSAVIEIGQTSS